MCCVIAIDKNQMIFAVLQIGKSSPVQLLIGKSGRLYICVVVWLFVCHGRYSSDVTLMDDEWWMIDDG